jgi:hypothetical protein
MDTDRALAVYLHSTLHYTSCNVEEGRGDGVQEVHTHPTERVRRRSISTQNCEQIRKWWIRSKLIQRILGGRGNRLPSLRRAPDPPATATRRQRRPAWAWPWCPP